MESIYDLFHLLSVRFQWNKNSFQFFPLTVFLLDPTQSFNAVIGPNGSGKSNVIDSLLFVFGFRAQKIRTKKISVLIHNSDQHPNVNSCYVKIFFRKIRTNGAGVSEVIPNSEFTVKRTAYKDNSSEYHIDDKRVC